MGARDAGNEKWSLTHTIQLVVCVKMTRRFIPSVPIEQQRVSFQRGAKLGSSPREERDMVRVEIENVRQSWLGSHPIPLGGAAQKHPGVIPVVAKSKLFPLSPCSMIHVWHHRYHFHITTASHSRFPRWFRVGPRSPEP